MSKQVCSVCGLPLAAQDHPNAKVSHMSCAMEESKNTRERLQAVLAAVKDREAEFNRRYGF